MCVCKAVVKGEMMIEMNVRCLQLCPLYLVMETLELL